MNLSKWKVVLLDIDGTLLDSNDAHARAWVRVLAERGHDVPYETIRPLIGKGGDKLLLEAASIDEDSETGQQITKARRSLFAREFLPTLQPTQGARALLERLLDDGLRLAVATSAGGDELQGLLRQAGVDDLVKTAATSADAEASKPDPDIIAAALQKAGVDAAQAVMLGDTPHDVEAARAAGVATLALRCGGWWQDRDFDGALAVFDDPADLTAHLDSAA